MSVELEYCVHLSKAELANRCLNPASVIAITDKALDVCNLFVGESRKSAVHLFVGHFRNPLGMPVSMI